MASAVTDQPPHWLVLSVSLPVLPCSFCDPFPEDCGLRLCFGRTGPRQGWVGACRTVGSSYIAGCALSPVTQARAKEQPSSLPASASSCKGLGHTQGEPRLRERETAGPQNIMEENQALPLGAWLFLIRVGPGANEPQDPRWRHLGWRVG